MSQLYGKFKTMVFIKKLFSNNTNTGKHQLKIKDRMKNLVFTIWIGLVLVGGQSCEKDMDEFIPTNTTTIVKSDTAWQEDLLKISDISTGILPPLNVEKLMADLATDPIVRELNAERGGIITTPDSVTVEFPANSCVTKSNRPCTGNLTVEILVLRKKGEFLLNNVPTTSLGRLLISGGAVRIKMSQNGEEVRLARPFTAPYRVKFQSASNMPDPAMKLFEGTPEGRFKFDWIPMPIVGTTVPVVRTWTDSSQGRLSAGFELLLDRFAWINCDKFSGDSTNLTNKFCVALPDTFTNQNTSVFVVFKELNSVVSLIGDGRTKQFCVPTSYRGLPIGKVVNIVSISTIKERIYISKKEVTIAVQNSNAAAIRLEATATTKEAAKEIISNL
jgi:hypothetical protein